MPHTDNWDESKPLSTMLGVNMDDETIKLRRSIRERSATDHELSSSDTTEAWKGQHTKVTFKEPISDPSTPTQACVLYQKTGDGKGDLRAKNNYGIPSKVISVGMVDLMVSASVPTGWLELNGDTIGDASSGATHAHANYEDLFTHLWNNVSNDHCPVSSGRGASAAYDWAAHKTLQLPDARGRVPIVAGIASGLTTRTIGDDSIGAEIVNLSHDHGGQAPHVHGIPDDIHTHTAGFAAISGPGPGTDVALANAVHDHGGSDVCYSSVAAAGSSTQAKMNPVLALLMVIKY